MSGALQGLGVVQTPPAFHVPAGACDCHTHVFGPAERYPFAVDRRYTPPAASVDDLLVLQRTLHFNRVVIVQPSPYGTDNSRTLAALRELRATPGVQARGVAVIDAHTTDAALREMGALGVRGLRVNLETGGQQDPTVARDRLLWAAARAAPLGWHVQVYTNLTLIAALFDVVSQLATPLVIDHFGSARAALEVTQPGFAGLLALVRSGRAYVKLSAPQRISTHADCADVAALAQALIAANPERMVWGSDWPHTGPRAGVAPATITPFEPVDDGRALNRLREWTPDPAILQQILVANPARLYEFD